MSGATANLADPETLAQARRAANEMRALSLLSVAAGTTSVWDVIHSASHSRGIPLRRLVLFQLLVSQEGWSARRANDALSHMLSLCLRSADTNVRHHTVGELKVSWLLDTRVGGMRVRALVDSLARLDDSGRPTPAAPWVGFPFAPVPKTVNRAGGLG